MKSELRHELQENDLTKYAEKSLGWFKVYGNLIMVVVCVVSIGASIAIYWQRVVESRNLHAWGELAMAHSAVDFQSIANDPVLSKSKAASWAMIQEGELRLQEGIRLMFTDRERAKRELDASQKVFEAILELKQPIDPEIRQRALFGLARSQESLSDGKLDNAIATYEKLIKEFPETLFRKSAEGRIAELKRKDASQFYAWFSKQNPTTASTRLPADQKASDTTKKKSTGTATSTKDHSTVELPNSVPILDVSDDSTKKTPPASVEEPLPAKKTPDVKGADPKAPAVKTTSEKSATPELPPLPAPSKAPPAKTDAATPPVPSAKSEPAKSEPAKTEPAPKSTGKADPAPKKSP